MTGKMLSQVGASLVQRYGTRDPFQIARELGITVLFCDGFGSLKGMYRVIKRNRYIFLNKWIWTNGCSALSAPTSWAMTSSIGSWLRPIACMSSCFMT